MKRYITFFVLLVLPGIVLAQPHGRVTGTVAGAGTGEALPGASVVLEGIRRGAICDADGRYAIENVRPGSYTLTASLVGYQAASRQITIEPGATARLNIELEEQAVSIGDVEVTANVVAERMRRDPEPITIISAQEIRGRATSIEQLLTKAAGVKIRRTGGMGSSSRINIHGLEGKRVQIFLDGDPVNSPDGNFTIDEIPIDLIERIEVYKGIIPARFGGDGIGGAINVVIREYDTDYIDLSYQRGSYNTNRTTWVFKKILPDAGIELGTGGFFNYAGNDYSFESPYQDGLILTRDHDQFHSFAAGGGIVFTKLWFDEIEIGGDLYFNRKEIQGIMENYQHAETRARSILPGFSLKKQDFFLSGLNFENDLTGVFAEGSFIDTSHVHYLLDGSINTADHSQGEIGYYAQNSENDQIEVRDRLNLNYRIDNRHSVNLNSSFRYAKLTPEDSLASAYAGYNVSGYPSSLISSITGLTHEYRSMDNRLVNMAGVSVLQARVEIAPSDLFSAPSLHGEPVVQESSFRRFGYSEALRYQLLPWFNVKASYQHALRLPNTSELFGDGAQISTSPDLVPEESDNFNLGFFLDRSSTLGIARLQFEANVFALNIENMIKLSTNGVTSGYVNVDRVNIRGMDAEIKADISEHLYVHGNMTWQDARDGLETRDDGVANPTYDMTVPNIPYLFGNFGAEYHRSDILFGGTYLKVFWESSYTHEFFYNWEMTKLNPRRIPSSFTHDAGVEMSFCQNRYTVSLEVQNLTNEEVLNDYNMPLMGRAMYLKLRYTLTQSAS